MKSKIITDVTTITDMMKIKFDDTDSHVDIKKLNVGFKTDSMLKELITTKKISERSLLDFRTRAKTMLIGIVKKLIERSPLKYSLRRNMAFLDPH